MVSYWLTDDALVDAGVTVFATLMATCASLGGPLATLRRCLALPGALGDSPALLGPSWRFLALSWRFLGASLAHLGASPLGNVFLYLVQQKRVFFLHGSGLISFLARNYLFWERGRQRPYPKKGYFWARFWLLGASWRFLGASLSLLVASLAGTVV